MPQAEEEEKIKRKTSPHAGRSPWLNFTWEEDKTGWVTYNALLTQRDEVSGKHNPISVLGSGSIRFVSPPGQEWGEYGERDRGSSFCFIILQLPVCIFAFTPQLSACSVFPLFAIWLLLIIFQVGPQLMGLVGSAALMLDERGVFGPIAYGSGVQVTCTLTTLENVRVHLRLFLGKVLPASCFEGFS